jgi:hypothetical protein
MPKKLKKPLEGFFVGPEKDVLLDKLTYVLDYFTKYIPSSGNLRRLDDIIEKLKQGDKLNDIVKEINEVHLRMKKGENLDDLLDKHKIEVDGLLKEPEVDLEELKEDIANQKRIGETMLYNFGLDYFTEKFFKGKNVDVITKYIAVNVNKEKDKKKPNEKVIRRNITQREKDIVNNPFESLTENIKKEIGNDYVIISNKMIFEIYDKKNNKKNHKNRKGKKLNENYEMKVVSRVKGYGSGTKLLQKYYDKKEFCDHYNMIFILKDKNYNSFKKNLINYLYDKNNNINIIEEDNKQINKKNKKNKYVSDHIIIEYNGQVIELQIRTKEQHEIATYGSADHYKYKKQRNKQVFNNIVLETLGLMPYIKKPIYERLGNKNKKEIEYSLIEDEMKKLLRVHKKSRKFKDELSITTIKELYKRIRKNIYEENKEKIKDGKKDEVIDFNKSVYCEEKDIKRCMKGIRSMIDYFNGDFCMPFSEKKLYGMFVDTRTKH